MACNSSTCQSGCYKYDQQVEVSDTTTTKPSVDATNNNNSTVTTKSNLLCLKCKTNAPISTPTDSAEFCYECFRSNLFGKFRLSVTSNAMVTPSDNVLVAFSGGPSSRVALQFVHEMQNRALKNFEACKDRSLPVFCVGVAFIDESTAYHVPSEKVDEAVEEMTLVVANLSPPTKHFHIVPIESIFTSDLTDGKNRLMKLLDGVNDVTGREDLLQHLRMLTLQKVAAANGYNKLVLGSCTSRIACHVIAATVKGKGYSLSADIQYVDARWNIPVVLPLRDCTSQELKMLCRLDGLKTLELNNGLPAGINGLISSFVTVLQEENPSRECTIVRTAGKLTPFHFNKIPEIKDGNVPLATRRRQKRYNLKPMESISSESFCAICNSPLNNSDLLSPSCTEGRESSISGAACSSCRFQILPKDQSSLEQFSMMLPPLMFAGTNRGKDENFGLLREKIQDFLLSDGEDEN